MKCTGCDKKPSGDAMMQCPLCSAEGSTTSGFFCSQECFGASWLAHRDGAHKKGVVRQKAAASSAADKAAADSASSPTKATKRSRGDKDSSVEVSSPEGRTKRTRAEKAADRAAEKQASEDKKAKIQAPLLVGSFWRPLPSAAHCLATGSCQLSGAAAAAADAIASPKKRKAAKKIAEMTSSKKMNFDTLPGRTEVTLCDVDASADVTVSNPTIVPSAHMWSACQSVSTICRDVLVAEKADSTRNIVIVCGSALSAFAVAWAMRCMASGDASSANKHLVTPELVLSTTHSDLSISPANKKLKSRVRVVRTSVLRSAQYNQGKVGANLSQWVDGNLVITMPDVVSPEDFQTMLSRAINIRSTAPSSEDDAVIPQTLSLLKSEDIPAIESHFPRESGADLNVVATGENFDDVVVAEDDGDEDVKSPMLSLFASGSYFIHGRQDDNLATFLARGDLESVISRVVQLYDMHSRSKFEEMVSNAFLCDRGGLQVWQQSHKIAFLLRRWATIAERGCSDNKEARNLMGSIAKSLTRATESMPTPLYSRTDRKVLNAFATKAAASVLPTVAPALPSQLFKDTTNTASYISATKTNMMIALQATLIYLLNGSVPEVYVDRLASVWGISELVVGWNEFDALNQHRSEYVSRLVSRYSLLLADVDVDFGTAGIASKSRMAAGISRAAGGQVSRPIAGGTSVATKMPVGEMQFVTIMYHLCCNHAARFATMTVKDLDFVLQWSHSSLQHFLGSIHQFVLTSGLAEGTLKGIKGTKHEKEADKKAAATKTIFTAANITDATYLKPVAHLQSFKLVVVPVSQRENIQKDRMGSAALDELLSALPKNPLPMYVGDVGQLIGIWSKFNAKYGGRLGYKLTDFLAKYPDEFTVVGNVVTRLKVGKTEQIRVRFDNEISSDDEDGDGNDDMVGTGGNLKKRRGPVVEGKQLHRKARRREEKKSRNKDRFDKNHKNFDPTTKVPGYVKHGARKLKGRGNKANIRIWKRQI